MSLLALLLVAVGAFLLGFVLGVRLAARVVVSYADRLIKCPTCGHVMYPIKSPAHPGQTGWECSDHGVMAWISSR